MVLAVDGARQSTVLANRGVRQSTVFPVDGVRQSMWPIAGGGGS